MNKYCSKGEFMCFYEHTMLEMLNCLEDAINLAVFFIFFCKARSSAEKPSLSKIVVLAPFMIKKYTI